MRLCRFEHNGDEGVGFYFDSHLVPLNSAVKGYSEATGQTVSLPSSQNLLEFLPPNGSSSSAAQQVSDWVGQQPADWAGEFGLETSRVQLLIPFPRPNKLFLLAGNYAAHIEEGGQKAVERAETFPYVFMKPPTTTLRNPGLPVPLPSVNPNAIDYELELAVVIGREAKGITEAEALDYVAGYTVINDISDRKFTPNPGRRERERDKFFDWMHGKWHDDFCPCGPCVVSANNVSDPQNLDMQLAVNGDVRQDASTALQIFPVAAVIEFISSFVTLEPGDIISTGTPAGVGNARGVYLQPGDVVTATIEGIGSLETPMVAPGEA